MKANIFVGVVPGLLLRLTLVPFLATHAPRIGTVAMRATDQTVSAPNQSAVSAKFDVATIKPSTLNATSGNVRLGGREVLLEHQTIAGLMELAYQVHSNQIVGGPAWFREKYFDVVGVPNFDAVPSLSQLQTMLKDLLENRCSLVFHREQKQMRVYVLSIDDKGAKLSKSSLSTHAVPSQTGTHDGSQRTRIFKDNSMSDFILGMQDFVDRPIINKTGLMDHYNFQLTWSPDTSLVTPDSSAPDLFTALKEQLGLRLKAQRGPADVLVIDAVDLPSEN